MGQDVSDRGGSSDFRAHRSVGVAVVRDEEVDVIVLGAGITGLVAASVLVREGNTRVLVVDEYEQPGGNHLDRNCHGFTFDVGSFIFQDDSPLLDHFPELLERYVPIDPSWAKLTPQGVVTTYPFSVRDDFLAAGPIEWARMLGSVAFARIARRRQENARDFARYWIGARMLHRSGLENYMERFCGRPADQIDLGFARQRMMWIAENASLRRVARTLLGALRRQEAPCPTNRQMARPREGFGALYEPVVRRLQEAGVTFALGTRAMVLRREGGAHHLETDAGTARARRVVSTIPVDRARDLVGVPAARRLPTVSLVTLFFSFSGRRGFDTSILYNFSHEGAWKRLTVYSDFYGLHTAREFFAVEVIGGQVDDSPERAERDFRDHVRRNGLLEGDLVLEGDHLLGNAYPVYTGRADLLAAEGIAALRAAGVESFGRQGGFQYQPTARVSTHVAEAALGAAPSPGLHGSGARELREPAPRPAPGADPRPVPRRDDPAEHRDV